MKATIRDLVISAHPVTAFSMSEPALRHMGLVDSLIDAVYAHEQYSDSLLRVLVELCHRNDVGEHELTVLFEREPAVVYRILDKLKEMDDG